MVNSRSKGKRLEKQFEKLTGGKRHWANSGGPVDVVAFGLDFQVKGRSTGFSQLYKWLEGADAAALKADRKEWLIVIPLDRFIELMEQQ